MIFTRWPNLLTTDGTRDELPWSEFVDEFSRIQKYRGENKHPGWSPAEFRGNKRDSKNVEQVHALCLDYDKGTSVEAAAQCWASTRGLLHTSRKHTHGAPRFRVVLPLSRPVSAFEFGALWARVYEHTGRRIDTSPKDASRFWYVPGVADHEGACFEARNWDGPELDPDEWLAKPAPRPTTTTDADLRPVDPTAIERRAIAYIDKMPEAISGQGGHRATWLVAVYLARGFGLGEQATLRILREHYNPRCQPPWSEKELKHKAQNAARAKLPDRFMLDDDPYVPDGKRDMNVPPEPPPDPDPDYVPEPPEEIADVSADSPAPTPRTDQRPAVERFGLTSIRGLLAPVYAALLNPKAEDGISTGNEILDNVIGKFRRGNVAILGAKRAFGKTSYSISVTDAAINSGRRVLLFAGEDSAMMYGKRYMALRAGLNATALRDLDLTENGKALAASALAAAPTVPFFVRTAGRPVEWVAKAITEICAEEDVALVVVDYLQCIRAAQRQQDRRNEVTYVARCCVDAIKSANCAGLLLSQLKRTERNRPDVEDLKESGDLEDMAEHILLGWKETETEKDLNGNTVTLESRFLSVAKNKDGPAGDGPIELAFDPVTASFKCRGAGEDTPTHRPGEEDE